jgi:hypothetical protein
MCWRGGFSEGRLARRELEDKAGQMGQFQGRLCHIRPSLIDVTGPEQGQRTGWVRLGCIKFDFVRIVDSFGS